MSLEILLSRSVLHIIRFTQETDLELAKLGSLGWRRNEWLNTTAGAELGITII